MTIEEAIKIIKSECYTANLLNLDRTRMVNTALALAIKALEQQPCEDCISRKAVINTIFYNSDNNCDVVLCTDLMDRIKHLPSVTPKAEWIPVSERLPEDYIHVLCQFYLGGMGECYLAHGAFHLVGGVVMTCNEVIAWMPLPEPYKAESEKEE